MEAYVHCAATRMRVIGSGNLQLQLQSLDSVRTVNLAPLALSSTNAVEPTVLTNFMSQRMALKVSVTDFDAHFRINKLILFIRPVYTGQPQ